MMEDDMSSVTKPNTLHMRSRDSKSAGWSQHMKTQQNKCRNLICCILIMRDLWLIKSSSQGSKTIYSRTLESLARKDGL